VRRRYSRAHIIAHTYETLVLEPSVI